MTAPVLFGREMKPRAIDSWELRIGCFVVSLWLACGRAWGRVYFDDVGNRMLLWVSPSGESTEAIVCAVESWFRTMMAETVGALGLELREVES